MATCKHCSIAGRIGPLVPSLAQEVDPTTSPVADWVPLKLCLGGSSINWSSCSCIPVRAANRAFSRSLSLWACCSARACSLALARSVCCCCCCCGTEFGAGPLPESGRPMTRTRKDCSPDFLRFLARHAEAHCQQPAGWGPALGTPKATGRQTCEGARRRPLPLEELTDCETASAGQPACRFHPALQRCGKGAERCIPHQVLIRPEHRDPQVVTPSARQAPDPARDLLMASRVASHLGAVTCWPMWSKGILAGRVLAKPWLVSHWPAAPKDVPNSELLKPFAGDWNT